MAQTQNCTNAPGCVDCFPRKTDCSRYPLLTSPTARYFGWDNGYAIGKSFKIGVSTQQALANFTLTVFYSTDAGTNYQFYGTINVARPPGGVADYAYGNYVDFNVSTLQPVSQNFYLKIAALPPTLQGSNPAANEKSKPKDSDPIECCHRNGWRGREHSPDKHPFQ